jgi:hypothetical protein
VSLGLFAIGTVIEVLANTALVPGADDWEHSTTITLAFLVDDLSIFDAGLLFLFGILGEHLFGLFLELFLDELFDSLFAISTFLSILGAFFLFVFQLRVRTFRFTRW